MALNLWKIGGQPTAFNPLPSGNTNTKVSFNNLGEYVVIIKAKSASSMRLRVWIDGEASTDSKNLAQLNPISTVFTFPKSVMGPGKNLYIAEYSGLANDIIIDSIELVQKPLPNLTLNGFDGLLESGAVFVDGSLGSSTTVSRSVSFVPVKPNTIYTISRRRFLAFYDANKVFISVSSDTSGNDPGITFTTPSNCAYVKFSLTTTDLTTKVMLNLGTIPAPYSKKTGDKMVLPVAKKNLFDINRAKVLSNYTINTYYSLPLQTKPDTFYTLKHDDLTKGAGSQFFVALSTVTGYTSSEYTFAWHNTGTSASNPITVKTKSDGKLYFSIYSNNGMSQAELDRFIQNYAINIQVEESTTPTKFEPYAVQLNPKPKKFVPKKNLFDGVLTLGDVTTSGAIIASTDRYIPKNPPRVQSGKTYVLSRGDGLTTDRISVRDINGVVLSSGLASPFTTPPGAYDVIWRHASLSVINTTVQLEEGTTQTAYEPYQLITPRAKTGLSFNGVTDYLQLPSMTIDSIEIDCLIDTVQNQTSHYILDARDGGTAYVHGSSISSGLSAMLINGVEIGRDSTKIIKGSRIKMKISTPLPFTDDVTFFNIRTGGSVFNTRGTIYKVTPYLNGVPLVTYDFENPSNIIGSTIIPNAKNLIPSFEDARWSLHANTQVLGKDVLRLNASGGSQWSVIKLPVLPSASYMFSMFGNGSKFDIEQKDINNTVLAGGAPFSVTVNGFGSQTFTTDVNAKTIDVIVYNSIATGTFDIIQPKLIQLDGKEATLVGKPTQLNKASKRNLYAKR